MAGAVNRSGCPGPRHLPGTNRPGVRERDGPCRPRSSSRSERSASLADLGRSCRRLIRGPAGNKSRRFVPGLHPNKTSTIVEVGWCRGRGVRCRRARIRAAMGATPKRPVERAPVEHSPAREAPPNEKLALVAETSPTFVICPPPGTPPVSLPARPETKMVLGGGKLRSATPTRQRPAAGGGDSKKKKIVHLRPMNPNHSGLCCSVDGSALIIRSRILTATGDPWGGGAVLPSWNCGAPRPVLGHTP